MQLSFSLFFFFLFPSLEFKTTGCIEHVLLAKQADMTSKTKPHYAKNAMENSQLFLLTLLKQFHFAAPMQSQRGEGVGE